MGQLNAFILYDGLPIKSGGAHKLSRQNATALYHSVARFAKLYADCKIPVQVQIVMREFNLKSFFVYTGRFGLPSFNGWNYWETKQDLVRWNVS